MIDGDTGDLKVHVLRLHERPSFPASFATAEVPLCADIVSSTPTSSGESSPPPSFQPRIAESSARHAGYKPATACLGADMSCGPQFVVRTARHPRFERRGADLHLNATISLVDALVGFAAEARSA